MKTKDRSTLHSVSKLSNHLRRKFDAISFGTGYTAAEARTIRFILLNHDKTLYQKDIEEEYALRPSTASQLLARMEKDGLITRAYDQKDSRLKHVRASASAALHTDTVAREFDLLEQQITSGIDPEDLLIFFRVVEKMIRNIQ